VAAGSSELQDHNVASEQKEGNSVLSFYRQLLALRHKEPALLEGNYVALNENDPNVFIYVRRYKDEAILVGLNMSAKEQRVQLDLSPLWFQCAEAEHIADGLSQTADGFDRCITDGAVFGVYCQDAK